MSLRWRIVGILLVASLLPLFFVGVGSCVVFGRMLADSSLELHGALVRSHAAKIDLYLAERLRALDFASRTLSAGGTMDQSTILEVLENINASHGAAFIDLGVIGSDGRHVAYAGPYALQDKNYAGEEWFSEVMARGRFVSDVFMGFRRVPHCVIAIRREDASGSWILRAAINSDDFNSLVRTEQLGKTGEVFIINEKGSYQTPPRHGQVLEMSPIGDPVRHSDVRHGKVEVGGVTMLRTTTWLNDGRWMLVAHQAESEVRAPVRRAMLLGGLVIMTAVIAVAATTVMATWHLTGRIDRANEQRDRLYDDWMRSAKLASIGELATGLAHEINNPLAIISAEQTNIGDLLGALDASTTGREEMLDSASSIKRNVERCGSITAKMLQFGRKSDPTIQPTAVGPRLEEVARLMGRQAQVRNIDIVLEVENELPDVPLDPTELEQVLVNVVTNAIHAIEGSGRVVMSARREGDGVLIEVRDNGSGIAPEVLVRIFEPFFTTKPPGQGTGLGLAVCHGIVRSWGGSMTAASELGKGSVITIRLPVPVAGRSESAARGKEGI